MVEARCPVAGCKPRVAMQLGIGPILPSFSSSSELAFSSPCHLLTPKQRDEPELQYVPIPIPMPQKVYKSKGVMEGPIGKGVNPA